MARRVRCRRFGSVGDFVNFGDFGDYKNAESGLWIPVPYNISCYTLMFHFIMMFAILNACKQDRLR